MIDFLRSNILNKISSKDFLRSRNPPKNIRLRSDDRFPCDIRRIRVICVQPFTGWQKDRGHAGSNQHNGACEPYKRNDHGATANGEQGEYRQKG